MDDEQSQPAGASIKSRTITGRQLVVMALVIILCVVGSYFILYISSIP